MEGFIRASLVGKIQRRFKIIDGNHLPLAQAREMVRYQDKNRQVPAFAVNQIYCKDDETFYDCDTRSSASKTAFNDVNSRYLLSNTDIAENRAKPEQMPADLALNIHGIPTVEGKRYAPGKAAPLFESEGLRYVNTFTERGIVKIPDKPAVKDLRDLEIVKEHFALLYPDTRERGILISFLAYIARSHGRVNFAVLLVGPEGDGKTTLIRMMDPVLGKENTFTVTGKLIEEAFNPWAEGHRLVNIEEVHWVGRSRYDVKNAIKPYITNDTINIRRMRRTLITSPTRPHTS
jgi:Family of unknown function (DUF5906)